MEEAKKSSTAKVLSTIALFLAIGAIVLAIIFDITAFAEVVLQFVAALILPIFAFVFLLIAMIASFIFIFGIYLAKEYGFWPLSLSIQFFKEIVDDIEVTQSQIDTFRALRVVLIVICVAIITLAIISKVLAKKDAQNGVIPRVVRSTRGKATAALILGILGFLVSIGALAITSAI